MLQPGSRLGVYEVVSPLGAGGMGEVYRARDTKLGRDVALKILPASFGTDPERVARFQREAQLLASLNHPHIAAIYAINQDEPTPFLALELVEGGTLDERLKGGPLDVSEAVAVARQVAEALGAAHDKGIIHRDLKPANIALTRDGQVKVLDFGLAKAVEVVAPGELSHSPTLTFAATQAGIILGTAAYMSPEQAKGRATDKRTDVWAFGCVVYEMLTGRRAFQGEDVTDTIAAIVRGEPDWSALPTNVSEQVRLLLKRCLDKDPRSRVGDIAVARFLLNETLPAAPAATPIRGGRRSPRAGTAAVLGVGLALGVAAAAIAWVGRRADPPPPVRFAFAPTGAQALGMYGPDRNVDLSLDGKLIAYRGANPATRSETRLFVRALREVDAHAVTDIGDVRGPFFSPDGAWIGYFSGQELKKVPTGGGTPITICRVTGGPRGASWGSDGNIVFATAENVGLLTVPASGGHARVLVPGGSDGLYAQPWVLPGAKALLFTVLSSSERTHIMALDLTSKKAVKLVDAASTPRYADGELWFASTDGSIRVLPFDPATLSIHGEPVTVVESVMRTPLFAGNYAVADGGTLVYVPAGSETTAGNRTPLWVDRHGRETPIDLPSHAYADVRISPDGERLALGARDLQNDIWIGDLRRHTLTRLTFDPAVDQQPLWTPDGRKIVWTSQRGSGVPSLFIQAADGTGPAEPLFRNGNPLFPTAISADGLHVLTWENNPTNAQDLLVVDLKAPGAAAVAAARPLLHTPAAEMDGDISADGRWLVYQSNESGQAEIYVRPFPNVDDGRWQVSTLGGTRPAWARSGREIFYVDVGGYLASVPVETGGATFRAGNPVRLFQARYYSGSTSLGLDVRGYDVSGDGSRFLVLKDAAADATSVATFSIVVSLNTPIAANASARR